MSAARDWRVCFPPFRSLEHQGNAFGTDALDFLLRQLQFRAPARIFNQSSYKKGIKWEFVLISHVKRISSNISAKQKRSFLLETEG